MSLAASDARGDLKQECLRGLDEVARQMTANQIAEAQFVAREWKRRGQRFAASQRDSQR
jgi:hypothetical protein